MSSESVSSAAGGDEDQLVGLLRTSRSKPDTKRRMEALAEHQAFKAYRNFYSLATFSGLSYLTLVIVWCAHFRGGFAWRSNPNLQFNWHPVLMSLGLVFFYSQAMLIFRTGKGNRKYTLKLLHAFIHCGAFICSVIGLVAVFDYHNNSVPIKPNMYTLHSWLGLFCVIVYSIQFFAGFTAFLFPGFSGDVRRLLLPVHVIIGVGLFILVLCTCFMGFTEKAIWGIGDYSSFGPEGMLVNFSGVILAVYGMLCLFLVIHPTFKRIHWPEDQVILSEQ